MLRFTCAQHVQVGAMQNENSCHFMMYYAPQIQSKPVEAYVAESP